jgi:thermitase
MRVFFPVSVLCISLAAGVSSAAEYLVRFNSMGGEQDRFVSQRGGKLTLVSEEGMLFKWTTAKIRTLSVPFWNPSVSYIQPNFTIRLLKNPSIEANRPALMQMLKEGKNPFVGSLAGAYPDNPEINAGRIPTTKTDPLLKEAWGMAQIGAATAWSQSVQGRDIIVAVTDTGVDYNHEDLVANMWRNTKEIPDNGLDDDKNGYIDDLVGWDFAANDNKPYDLSGDLYSLLFGGGNPGHGTHVSGVIAASYNNAIGIAGVAPQAKIMALRFISERGQGTTENVIKAIDYAVANGAKVINASWGGEKGDEDDSALIEAIERAEKAGVIFVTSAGNGRSNGTGSGGYDNDNDPKPAIPSTLNIDNIVSVAAIDSTEQLGSFSNWGNRTVKLAAPGVKILSTVPGDRYQDTVIDLPMFGIRATWDGTSMATPHVAGAFALTWGDHPTWSYKQVVDSVLKATKPVPSLSGKVVTGGRLDLLGVR